jgi:dihydroflavonol-4-reductase
VFLLGVAGTVGSGVAQAFLDAGYELRCLARSRGHRNLARAAEHGAEIVYGDMNDDAALSAALKDCRYFVHSAAPFPWSGLHRRLRGYRETWIPQVKRHFELAKQAGIERAVFTSSLSTIGLAKTGELADESLPYDAARQGGGNYYPIKADLEAAVKEVDGPPIVIVNPTGLVGEGSRNPQLSAACVFFQGLAPAMVDATLNFVDTQDVGKGHVLALQKGTPGERYILGGVNTSLREFAELVAGMADRKRPMIIPRGILKMSAYFSEWWGLLTGKLGAVTLTSYYHLEYGQFYSSAKAERELGYQPTTDLREPVRRELAYHGVPLSEPT